MLCVVKYPVNNGQGLKLNYSVEYTYKFLSTYQSYKSPDRIRLTYTLTKPVFDEVIKQHHGRVSTANVLIFPSMDDAQGFVDYLESLQLMKSLSIVEVI
jgi:hypothetical protein